MGSVGGESRLSSPDLVTIASVVAFGKPIFVIVDSTALTDGPNVPRAVDRDKYAHQSRLPPGCC